MRLRYLHLPRCGPLIDISMVFGREELVARTLNLPRKGSLNFVVGVNGSGKSSLLRALYRIFRSLNLREWPALPVTLAWDRTMGDQVVTTLLHSTNMKEARSFFAILDRAPVTATRNDWDEIVTALRKGEGHPMIKSSDVVTGPEAILNPILFAHLPKRLIAYTSGTDDPWVQLDHPAFQPAEEQEGQFQAEDERAQGWSVGRELEEEQPVRINNLLERYTARTAGNLLTPPGTEAVDEQPSVARMQVLEDLGPLNDLRKKLWTNQQVRTEQSDESYFRVRPRHLRFAGIALALWQSAKEMRGRTEERSREALRNLLLGGSGSDEERTGARRVLNEIDWFWPTHMSLTYRDADDGVSPRQHQELLCLVALADEVIAQPRGRQRAIFFLGPSDRISLTEKLREAFPLGIPSKGIEFIAGRVDGCRTMSEAMLRVFSADKNIDSTPMDVFSRLRDWERTGLLEDITLTVKRLHRPEAADGERDDIIVTYDQLSDGEQMLLGRMGLLFLLRGQDGSLLLLDEPETHFNDVWKREIVEMIDLGLLNSTDANVIVATHTSIALTDAFAAEVTVLDKQEGGTKARGVAGGLLGTDPGEVTMNLFRAESSIGSRSVELLDRLLKTEWKGREGELAAILNVLGSSFHRAELRAILNQLRADNHGTSSS